MWLTLSKQLDKSNMSKPIPTLDIRREDTTLWLSDLTPAAGHRPHSSSSFTRCAFSAAPRSARVTEPTVTAEVEWFQRFHGALGRFSLVSWVPRTFPHLSTSLGVAIEDLKAL